ncbi:MAG: type VI secretion protein [Rhizobiales bacterium 65-9]|nr:type VI secretion system baseplate subunit TssF [Hyphomicrobiales bacterium]OJY37623.1 MAG: type VI secretion protein [Rhizobiales bacterium 65-9]
MHHEFVELYNRELALFYEHAKEFAEEFPGIADRLGGLSRERSDPMFAGLMQGAAFLAARVQLKLKHEFPEFTSNLIDQLLPGFLAPTPSALLAQVKPTFGDPALREGRTMKRGAFLDAVYREREKNVACRFTLCTDLTFWPFEVTRAEYVPTPGPLHALGIESEHRFMAGLRLTLRCRTAPRVEDEAPDEIAQNDPLCHFAGCPINALPFHLVGPEAEAIMLYEQIFGNRSAIFARHLDEYGDPKVTELSGVDIEQIGFGDDETLFPYDPRLFRGFAYLQEYFVFPRKFMGFRLKTKKRELFPLPARTIDLIITFREPAPRLAVAIDASMFALYAAPAVNLFPKTTDRIPIRTNQHEYQVIPDRSHHLNFEPHTVLDVFAHYPGRPQKERVLPLYSSPLAVASNQTQLHYTLRRLPRRRTSDERRFGSPSDYVGTDMFISTTAPGALGDDAQIMELSVRALCSNRHLTDQLPVGAAGADFTFIDDTSLQVVCIAGPTRPKEPPLHQKHDITAEIGAGPTAWRLINMLSLNYHGLTRSDGLALREILSIFADLNDAVLDRRIRSVRSIASRPVIRRLQSRTGVGAARGIEVNVTFDEKSFEGSGVFLLGAVLDRFFAEYAALNHFSQTVVSTVERGPIMRWPPRSGSRKPL